MASESPPQAFIPSRDDVHAARSILSSLGVPNELVLEVLHFARYWPETTHETSDHFVLFDEKWDVDFTAAFPYLWVPIGSSDDPDDEEQPKVREIEFLIVSHDQGWTTEDTAGTYKTSSWFEVSHARAGPASDMPPEPMGPFPHVDRAREYLLDGAHNIELMPRSSSEMEPQRLHCREMREVASEPEIFRKRAPPSDEGRYAWYLQGNKVGRGPSVFEGDLVKRYRVVWGCAANPRWEGNEGAGRGEGFLDSLRNGDWIVVWARAKRRGWDNHVLGVRVTVRYTI
ncbi:hypothetical protein BU26DRAFT_516032 [Trematosphaeria pertusa]|uniref:Uncharacterized protein n=1 Tax=Trematosphaeria pertusa TaxID=390896 RepID=A0A6A6ITP8_9PLEO|nr:uncharacterized protein BU26DRAFT_516032 [Trematosphaeria pertusa]KAF2253729.1 hypothetical protein BU26DRAFT_516032 [Trematosphaeria pertusa]